MACGFGWKRYEPQHRTLWLLAYLPLSAAMRLHQLPSSAKANCLGIACSRKQGLPNLFRVNANLYRSAKPERADFAYLNILTALYQTDWPIKTVLSLRDANDDSKFNTADLTLVLKQIRFHTWLSRRG